VRAIDLYGLPVYLLEHNGFYDRPNLYDDGLFSYLDNADRFAFLSKAALQICKSLSFHPQIINANDWTTALVPFFLRVHERDGFFQKTASVLTIHNAYYQGKFHGDKRHFIGIPDEYFISNVFEDQHGVNFLKAGLYFANKINAVSPSYAAELLTQGGSHGLHQYLRPREKDLRGILNGCDDSYWNPKTDPLIPAHYEAENISGKEVCKRETLKTFQLRDVADHHPLFGMVCRLTDNKGFAYLIPALYEILRKEKIGVIILGIGDPSLERDLYQLSQNFPNQMGFRAVFDERLAHYIYAGSDFFLMPSLFEPCGSCQMYSMAYGTLPVVRAVGGLKDTVDDLDEQTGIGTGFVFDEPTSEALCKCIQRAIHTYRGDKQIMHRMIKLAMYKENKWGNTAKQYLDMYEDALNGL
jgi:starch synthase